MPMSKPAIVELTTDHLYPAWRQESERLSAIDRWYRWSNEEITIPRGATPEHRALADLAKTPWLGLVVTNVAQSLRVDGYRTPEGGDDETTTTPWKLWNQNRLDGRQGAIWRGSLAYGASYGLALPGEISGERTAVLRGVSAREMLAFYADPAQDDWPLYAIRVRGRNIDVYDDTTRYRLGIESTPRGDEIVYITDDEHGVGECPVVRFTNMLDLDGRTDGEVEPFIPLAKRIDKTTYDRLLTQHFNSWKVRTIAGMSEPETAADAVAARLKLSHDSLLVSDSVDTKFGSLPETPLDGLIRAYESDIKTLAAATQTPVHAMIGDLVNLSAEALAAARASLDAKVGERQSSFGESMGQFLRIGSYIAGDDEAANDVMASPTWADTSIRSLAEAADALGKMATMLGIPPQSLWSRIPGVTKSDVEEWKQAAASSDVMGQLLAEIERSGTPAAA